MGKIPPFPGLLARGGHSGLRTDRVPPCVAVQLPGPAPNIRAFSSSPTSVTVTWEMPLSGNGDIQNYKLYYMEKGQDMEQVRGCCAAQTALSCCRPLGRVCFSDTPNPLAPDMGNT